MTCETAIDLVVDSLMDRLDPEEQAALDRHLASCAACAAEAAELGSLWQHLETVPAPAPTAETFIRFGRNLERSRRSTRWATGLRVAAALALLLGGGLVGRLTVEPPAVVLPPGPPSQAYLLVIRGDEPNRRFPERRLEGEYRDWAVDLAGEGKLIAAQRLRDDGGRWVRDLAPPDEDPATLALRGYFLIYADSYDEAVRLARESPHIAYGGTIEVRALQ